MVLGIASLNKKREMFFFFQGTSVLLLRMQDLQETFYVSEDYCRFAQSPFSQTNFCLFYPAII